MTLAGSFVVFADELPGDRGLDCPDNAPGDLPMYTSTDGTNWTADCDSGFGSADNGLEATYVASQVRQGSGQQAQRSAADRLRDLEELHQQGLIPTVEYAERREVIVKSL